ncbi:MAG TPA: transglutaminase family protein [Draconibacterium sp.]|nr:transglutaminase family protein [Draconibacterium sp.]
MQEFDIEYFIENKYEQPVRKANFQLLVIPDSNPQQKVMDLKFYCSENQDIHRSKNIFGFETITWYIGKPFSEFWFKMTAKIQKPDINPFYVSPLMPKEEYELIQSPDFQVDNHLFLSSTPLTQMPAVVSCNFPGFSGENHLFEYLLGLSNYLHNLLEYSPESTNVNTPIEEVLKIRKGVCQDFAHVLIAVCRQNKIPARYVSGYLNQGEGFTGASQLHAWVEVLIPELGWVGFDSTNNLLADHHYIKIAHGTDYRDCSPIIGVLESTGIQKSIHSVTVTNQ